MRKFYTFIIALLAVCGLAKAQVTFDFTGEKAYEQFGLAGFSSSESNDGDFTEVTSLSSGDVTITVSPSGGKNANRMWNGSLRLYGGTLTIISAGKNITSIQFVLNSSKWGADNSADSGELGTGTWTGDAASVVINIAGNTQIKSMTVSMGDEPGPGPDPQPAIDWTSSASAPLTVASVLEKAAQLEKGQSSDKDVYVQGKISSIKYVFDAEHGTATFSISDNGEAENEFLCYGTNYLGNRAWKDGDTQIQVGDEVIILGVVTNYNGTLEMASKKNCLYSLNGNTDGGDTPDPEYKEYLTVGQLQQAATANKVNVVFKSPQPLLVTFVNGSNCYVHDAGDLCLLLYGKMEGVKAGDLINGEIKGQLYLYNGLTEIAVSEVSNLTVVSSNNPVVPREVTIADVTNNYKRYESMLVRIKELVPETESWVSRNINFMDDSDNTIVVRDNFKTVADVTFDTSKSYDITGFVSIYNGTVQLFPRDAADLGGEAPQPYELAGEGTLENPYTIADLLHAGLDNNLQGWIHGYIVGYVDGQSISGAIFSNKGPEINAKLKEEDNRLTLSYSAALDETVVTEKFICTFENDLCVSAIMETSCPNEEFAQEYYNELLAEQQENPDEDHAVYSINGKVITADMSADYAGAPKSMVKEAMQMMANVFNDPERNPLKPSNTNLLLADTQDETNPAKCVPVQLANKYGMREALSLKDQPGNFNKEIWLHAGCEKYFSVAGVKNIDDWSFDGKAGVTAIKAIHQAATNMIYNLKGQRVNAASKAGIYVVNGRKVVVK